ncbi:MAG: hypothetical protein IT160_00885 [Bryobacterales bacterium]|nr:hypothetical protein [Bryobacterales bacterium]
MNAGLATLVMDGDPREAERLVLWAFNHQILDSASPDFGTIPWRVGHPEIRDSNAIEFCTQPLGPLFLEYGGRLSGEFRRRMKPHLDAALIAVRRHHVPITYTNIFLMKATNLLLAGQAAGNAKTAAEGELLLDQWIDYTRRAGIGEFDSPNYYTVDLNSLAMGYLYAAQERTREKYRKLLDFFWADITANFYPGRGTLSGPQSRSYQFLSGHESIELYLDMEGLRRSLAPERAGIGRIYLLINERKGGYRPPHEILALATLPEKVVRSRWREEAGYERYNYITPEFAIGSTNYHYTGHDKLIDVELGRREDVPAVFVAPDTTGRPYGRVRVAGPSGQTKPHHLPLNAASIQKKGALLALLDLDVSKEKDLSLFGTNVVYPLAAQRILRKISASGSILGLRVDGGGLAVRFFHLPEGASVALKTDPAGKAEGAGRFLVQYPAAAIRRLDTRRVRTGLLIVAEHCQNKAALERLVAKAGRAAIESEERDGLWTVACDIDGLKLLVSRRLADGKIVDRRVNGQPAASDVLSVNGKDLTVYLPVSGASAGGGTLTSWSLY